MVKNINIVFGILSFKFNASGLRDASMFIIKFQTGKMRSSLFVYFTLSRYDTMVFLFFFIFVAYFHRNNIIIITGLTFGTCLYNSLKQIYEYFVFSVSKAFL